MMLAEYTQTKIRSVVGKCAQRDTDAAGNNHKQLATPRKPGDQRLFEEQYTHTYGIEPGSRKARKDGEPAPQQANHRMG